MNKKLSAAIMATTTTLICTLASAHVSTNSGSPAQATQSQEITLQIAHGCSVTGLPAGQTATADTLSLKVDIPAGVTGVRAVSSADFPKVTVATDAVSKLVTSITWEKTDAGLAADSNFYKVTFRAKMPDKAFSKVYFKSHQKCVQPSTDAEWTAIPGDGSGAEAAPEVAILPFPKVTGWNKWTVPAGASVAAADMKAVFKDAQIVWKGTAAFSPNDVITAQIASEPGATVLAALAAGDEIFVKY